MIIRDNDKRIDELEAAMLEKGSVIDLPLVHRFTPGMYIREIFMPAGTLITSKIHKTTHPFTISQGAVAVSVDGKDWINYVAPYTGITEPGTRRILYIIEDCFWTTYHPMSQMKSDMNEWHGDKLDKLLKEIEDELLEPHINSIIDGDVNKVYKQFLNNKILGI